MQTEQLIQTLEAETRQIIARLEAFKTLEPQTLTWKADPQSWSILECLEHLNLYGRFYLPQMALKIMQAPAKPDPVFRSGFLGDYFAKSMLPKEKLNKMKTFKDKNPLNALLDISVLNVCLLQQKELLDLLNQSRQVNLNTVKIETSLSSLLRFRLGDTFRFIINHILRHLRQAERAVAEMKGVEQVNI
jgi:hypothetical protein